MSVRQVISFETDISLMIPILSVMIGVILWWHNRIINKLAVNFRRVQDDLSVSEQNFKDVLDSMLEGVQILDRNFCYRYVNDAVLEHGRKTREELLGKQITQVFPGIEKTTLFFHMEECLNNRIPYRMNNQFSYPDGETAWFKLSLQPVPDGIFILSIDITEQIQAEKRLKLLNGELEEIVRSRTKELQLSEERFRTLFNMGEDMILALSLSDGGQPEKFIEANKSSINFLGYTRDELLHMSPLDLDTRGEAAYEGMDVIDEDLENEGKSIINRLWKKKNGETFPVEISISKFEYLDEVISLIIGRDVSDRESVLRELKAAKEDAEAANVTKTHFLANMSHEIRTPLNSIIGYSELLLSHQNLTPEQEEQVQIIIRSGDHLLNLINDIIDISKIESGHVDFSRDLINVRSLFFSIESLFQFKAQEKKLGFRVQVR